MRVYAWPHNLDSHVAPHAAVNAQVSGAFWAYISMATQPGGREMYMSTWTRTIGNEVNDGRLRSSEAQPHRSGISGCRSGCCTLLLRHFAGDQLLRSMFHAAGQPAHAQIGGRFALSVSDRWRLPFSARCGMDVARPARHSSAGSPFRLFGPCLRGDASRRKRVVVHHVEHERQGGSVVVLSSVQWSDIREA